jgi:hypothetical protein
VRPTKLIIFLALLCLGLEFVSCSPDVVPTPDERTPFLEHRREMTTQRGRAPFDLLWIGDRAKLDALKLKYDKVYVAPVDLKYFEPDPKHPVPEESLEQMADYIHAAFVDALKETESNRFHPADEAGPDTFVLEIALIKLESTASAVNVVENVAGLFVPGAVPLVVGTNVAGALAAHEIGKGKIAIAARVKDGVTGEMYAETYDQRSDRAALLLNVEDFTTWGNARMIARNWAREFVELMNTPGTVKVDGPSSLGVILW